MTEFHTWFLRILEKTIEVVSVVHFDELFFGSDYWAHENIIYHYFKFESNE